MTSPTSRRTDPAAAHLLLDDLDLVMLFVDVGAVELTGASGEDDVLRLTLAAHPGLSPSALAATLCRVLLDLRVPSVRLERAGRGILLRCDYLTANGARAVELTATNRDAVLAR